MKALQNIRDYFAFKQNFSNFKRRGGKILFSSLNNFIVDFI